MDVHGTILIAEDTVIQAKKIVYYLEKFGHTVTAVENGKQALDELTARKDDYDLVITDIQMPVMDGLEFLAAVRNDAQLQQIPIVVLTTLQEEDVCLKAFSLGTSDFLTKPFRPEELKLRARNLIMLYRFEKMLVEENYVLSKTLMRKNQILEQNLVKLRQTHEELKDLQNRLLLASKMASIGVLSAGVAHEINNPLAVIHGYNERLGDLANDQSAPKKQEEELRFINEKIDHATTRISHIVNSLLQLAGNTSVAPAQKQEIPVNENIRNMEVFFSEMAKKHDVTTTYELSPENPKFTGNPTLFQQTMLNLIYNAIESMQETPVRSLTIKTILSDPFGIGGTIQIDVIDTGRGIPPDQLDKVFDPFFTTKPVGQGPGLGLSLVFTFVKNMGGNIQCHPQETGTRFSITLPLQPPAQTEPHHD